MNMAKEKDIDFIYGNVAVQRNNYDYIDSHQDIRKIQRIKKNRERALRMNLPYVLLLSIASICTLMICVSYLKIQSEVTARVRNISVLEEELESLKNANDATETNINVSVDLDHVYKVATEELGMVYARKSQVILMIKRNTVMSASLKIFLTNKKGEIAKRYQHSV